MDFDQPPPFTEEPDRERPRAEQGSAPAVKKWKFHVGIHRGTLMSRDSEPPKDVASLEECRAMAMAAKREYASFGCQIWYCYAMSPEGERHTLVEGAPYQ